jgi:hypothetical protein
MEMMIGAISGMRFVSISSSKHATSYCYPPAQIL